MNKRDLIYQCSSEAVMMTRISLRKFLKGRISEKELEIVDEELSSAMNRAGQYALNAYDSDARKYRYAHQLLSKLEGKLCEVVE